MITFTVPLIPPSVNHYKQPRRGGRGFYVTGEATAFKEAVAIFARGKVSTPYSSGLSVEINIYLGRGKKGDIDNFAKVCLDGLVEAGIIQSDAGVQELIMRKDRDNANPRTEITVKEL